MRRKSNNPAGFRMGDDVYIRLDVVLSVVDKATKHALKDWDNQTKGTLQKRLDEGADVDVRKFKAAMNENRRNLEQIAKCIRYAVGSLEEA